jgi:Zn-dependent membrane protease YugP
MLFILLIVFVLGFGAARYTASKYATAMALGQRAQAPEDKTGADIAAEFLAVHEASDVQIVRHNSVVSDYFDPKRRRLFLRSAIYDGKNLAAWAVALHEAAHALQNGEDADALRWRQSCISLSRYLPVGLGVLSLLMLVLRRLPGGSRGALLVFVGGCAVALLLNLGTLAVEFNANKRVQQWLEDRLERYPGALNRLLQVLSATATREVGDMLDSPRYFFLSALPGTGKIRPDKAAEKTPPPPKA